MDIWARQIDGLSLKIEKLLLLKFRPFLIIFSYDILLEFCFNLRIVYDLWVIKSDMTLSLIVGVIYKTHVLVAPGASWIPWRAGGIMEPLISKLWKG